MRACTTIVHGTERIIFLDIDGVLTSFRAHEQLDRSCVALLDDLADATGARLVLTSSWRDRFGLDETARRLAGAGLRTSLVAAVPALPLHTRSDEITQFLAGQEAPTTFVILDDVSVERRLIPHLVLVDEFVGLTPTDVAAAQRILARRTR